MKSEQRRRALDLFDQEAGRLRSELVRRADTEEGDVIDFLLHVEARIITIAQLAGQLAGKRKT